MYKKGIKKPGIGPKINIGIVVLLACITLFAFRVYKVLISSNERGGYAYVQMLNFGLPLFEEQAYDESDYHESSMTLKNVCLEALGLNNLSHFGIINNEISFFKQGFSEQDASIASITVNPFFLNDESVSKVEPTESKVSGVYDKSLKTNIDHSKPRVLIYHTHTTEGYSDGPSDTVDNSKNVVRIGEELTRILENDYGISVIHDKTNHYLSFTTCYEVSGNTVKSYLKKYGDFDLIIDLHRDGGPQKKTVTANINNEDVAKIMFVLGQNSGRYAANKALVDEFEGKANELFPGLIRQRTDYKRAKCGPNLGLSDGSLLIECGGNVNTTQEAMNTAKYIARLIAEHLNRK